MPITNTFLDMFIGRYPKITLIGMSGLGKSHWSKQLEKFGYKRLCCDDAIADRLQRPGGNGKITDLGKWMGFPDEPEYTSREKIYLSLEIQVLHEFVERLATAEPGEKIVIDTTGSAPYAGDSVMNQLGRHSCIIYLASSSAHHSEMLERYIRCPRPVLWGDKFRPKASESKEDAMVRCYGELLIYRHQLYKKHAHYTVPYEAHRV